VNFLEEFAIGVVKQPKTIETVIKYQKLLRKARKGDASKLRRVVN
jgi:hypothetical protein